MKKTLFAAIVFAASTMFAAQAPKTTAPATTPNTANTSNVASKPVSKKSTKVHKSNKKATTVAPAASTTAAPVKK